MIRTPAQPGKWPGFNTTRAVAWLMEVGWVSGPQAWVARYKKLSHGPCSLNEAKKAVLAMISGKFAGFVAEVVKDPIGHMNSAQARLMAREAAVDPVTLVGSDHWSQGSGIDKELRRTIIDTECGGFLRDDDPLPSFREAA